MDTRPLVGLRWGCLGGAVSGLVLYAVSLRDYGEGPASAVGRAVLEHYGSALIVANLRLALCLALVGAFWGGLVGVAAAFWAQVGGVSMRRRTAAIAGMLAVPLVTLAQLARALVLAPGTVMTLWPYDVQKLDLVYDHVPASGLDLAAALGVALLAVPWIVAIGRGARVVLPRGRALLGVPANGRWTGAPVGVTAGAAVLLPLPLVALSLSHRAVPPFHSTAPNLVLLMGDSLRQDRVHAKHGDEPVMPNVAGLAGRGAELSSCFVPVARTTESIVTLLTGAWPQAHGVRVSWTDREKLPIPALPRILAEQGYDTIAAGDWTSTELAKFDMGFERLAMPPEQWCLPTFVRRGGRLTALLVTIHLPAKLCECFFPELAYYPGVDASGLVRSNVHAELESQAKSGRPFFLAVFTANTHAPFTPRGDHYRRFAVPGYRGPNRYGLWARTIDAALALGSEGMRANDLAQVQAVYDASARTFDEDVGFYVRELERLGLAKNTIVVVLSDHGTAFYERGSFGQGNEIVSDVSNRIPCVLYDPTHPGGGRDVKRIVREVDLAPTFLDLLGLPPSASMEGVSLRPYLEGSPRDLGLVAYGETGLWIGKQPWQTEELDFGFPPITEMCTVRDWATGLFSVEPRWVRLMIRAQHRMVRDEDWKLVSVPVRSGPPRLSLYSVAAGDRGGDVASEHPEVVRRLLARLDDWLEREDPTIWADELPPPRVTRRKTAGP